MSQAYDRYCREISVGVDIRYSIYAGLWRVKKIESDDFCYCKQGKKTNIFNSRTCILVRSWQELASYALSEFDRPATSGTLYGDCVQGSWIAEEIRGRLEDEDRIEISNDMDGSTRLHPISRLMGYRIARLTGHSVRKDKAFQSALNWCEETAAQIPES